MVGWGLVGRRPVDWGNPPRAFRWHGRRGLHVRVGPRRPQGADELDLVSVEPGTMRLRAECEGGDEKGLVGSRFFQRTLIR